MHFYCAIPAHFLYPTAFFTIITNFSCYPVHYPLPQAQMSSIDTALLYLCIPLCLPLCILFRTYYDVTGLLHCYAVPAILEHRKRNKMACSHHFIPFSVFGVSISINCLFVQAQTQFILLTLTSYYWKS